MEIGTRVGAIWKADADTIFILGYGVYSGEEIPKTAGNRLGRDMMRQEMKSPKIVLDSGKIVWGCECFFTPEAGLKKQVDGYKNVVTIDIEEARAALAGRS